MRLILILTLYTTTFAYSQTVDVMNYNNGTKSTVPTTSSSQLLPTTGATNSVQIYNGTTWSNTQVAGVTFQTLSNYWTKTGSNLSYNSGNITIGTVNSRRVLEHNGYFNIPFQSDTVPTTLLAWLTMGSFTRTVTNNAGTFIYNISASTSPATLNLPISTLVLQGRSNSDVFSNVAFITGSSPSVKALITATDFRLPYLASTETNQAAINASGAIERSPTSWTSTTRPASPFVGQMGYNTETANFEGWTGSAWVNLKDH